MRNVIPETTSQKTACDPWDETAPSVSRATIAATVKKTRSQRKSDLRSLRFSARTSADVSNTANAYPSFVACLAIGQSLRRNLNLGRTIVKRQLANSTAAILRRMPAEYDAIIVGDGHNGLAAAAYLGRAGLKTVVLERRGVLGGAAVSEHPWPGYTVSTLSYVLSLMPPEVIRELELHRHGLTLYPLAADYYVPFPDGSHLLLTKDAGQAKAEIGKFSRKDADAWPVFSEYLAKIARVVRPLLLMTPPAVGAKSPADLMELARFAWKLKGLDVKSTGDFVKVMTPSVAELLDEWFESPQVKAARSVSGAIGTYGGSYIPGTARGLLRPSISEVDGQMAEWAFVPGGPGAVSEAITADARAHGAEIRTGARVGRVLVENGRAVGVALVDGTELRARAVVSNAHPQITVCELVAAT